MVYVTPVSRNGLLQSGIHCRAKRQPRINRDSKVRRKTQTTDVARAVGDFERHFGISSSRGIIEWTGRLPFMGLDRLLAFNTLDSITGPFPPTLFLPAHGHGCASRSQRTFTPQGLFSGTSIVRSRLSIIRSHQPLTRVLRSVVIHPHSQICFAAFNNIRSWSSDSELS